MACARLIVTRIAFLALYSWQQLISCLSVQTQLTWGSLTGTHSTAVGAAALFGTGISAHTFFLLISLYRWLKLGSNFPAKGPHLFFSGLSLGAHVQSLSSLAHCPRIYGRPLRWSVCPFLISSFLSLEKLWGRGQKTGPPVLVTSFSSFLFPSCPLPNVWDFNRKKE